MSHKKDRTRAPDSRTVVFVGGDERQARAVEGLELPAGVRVVSIQPGWNPNNNKALAVAERAVAKADALAISTDVPTLLGRDLRRLARRRGIPWTSGRARGRAAICGLIDQAMALSDVSDPASRTSIDDAR